MTTSSPLLLTELTTGCRAIFEKVLDSALGHKDSTGACLYASILLSMSVQKFSPYQAVVRGGGEASSGGVFLADGQRKGHYWVEAVREETGERWVLDIAGDQFGLPAVQVLEFAQASHYVPGDQAEIDEHVQEELAVIEAAYTEQ